MTKNELLAIGPNPARIRETIKEVRESVHVKDERVQINFMEQAISRRGPIDDPACGTVACHGGLFALALCPHENEYVANEYVPGEFILLFERDPEGYQGSEIRYEDGVDEFSRRIYAHVHADFIDNDVLSEFMRDHPDVWGNDEGYEMFGTWGYTAFDKEFDDCDIDDILDWWLDVAARKDAWDAANGIVYPASQTYPEPRIS